jgi:hypothetical protein
MKAAGIGCSDHVGWPRLPMDRCRPGKGKVKPIPCGRKKGGRNRSIEQRKQAAYEKQCARDWHRVVLLNQRQVHRAQRWEDHKNEARRKRVHAGGPFWTDEEWEAL